MLDWTDGEVIKFLFTQSCPLNGNIDFLSRQNSIKVLDDKLESLLPLSSFSTYALGLSWCAEITLLFTDVHSNTRAIAKSYQAEI